jgi:hypothetical protein
LPVEPIDTDAADQREQQPRELLGEHGSGDERRIVGTRGDEQRPGDQSDAVTEIGNG